MILPAELSTLAFIGKSEKSKEMLQFALKAANTESSVLLTGENGSGKDYLAQRIHQLSSRKSRTHFVVVDCGSITETLIESELFGSVRGAYTGAVQEREGLVQVAEGGTLFLNEVGNATPLLQAKLLRITEKKELRKVGSAQDYKVNTRIISATNMNLADAIKEGKFRKDLFYRLNVINFIVPPLRDRKEDIAELATNFLEMHAPGKVLSSEALLKLYDYDWPGNIRELQNVIESGIFNSELNTIINVTHLCIPENKPRNPSGFVEKIDRLPFPTFMENYREYIKAALVEAKGSVGVAEKLTGLTNKTIYARITEFGLKEFFKELKAKRKQ